MIHRGPPMTTTRSMALLLRFRYKLQGLWPSRSSFQLMRNSCLLMSESWRVTVKKCNLLFGSSFFDIFAGIYFYYFCCLIATTAVATNGHSTLPWHGAALDLACSPLKRKLNFWNSEQNPKTQALFGKKVQNSCKAWSCAYSNATKVHMDHHRFGMIWVNSN